MTPLARTSRAGGSGNAGLGRFAASIHTTVCWQIVKRFVGRGANQAFTCAVCGEEVRPLATGSYRNHCPACLCSLHVDINPGDRANDCGGVMEAVGAELSGKKGWVIVHRCRECGEVRRNKAALSDPDQPDDLDVLARLAGGWPLPDR